MDVMIDLETFGNSPGCGMFAIGAVAFSPEESWVAKPFFALIRADSLAAAGLTQNPQTMDWWRTQSPEAQAYFHASLDNQGETIEEAFARYGAYLAQWKDSKPWGFGSDFDNAIMRAGADAIGQDAPWKYRNSRCHRTMAAERPEIRLDRVGTYHNALDDAISQADQAVRVLRAVRGLEPAPVQHFLEDQQWVVDPIKAPLTMPARKPGI